MSSVVGEITIKTWTEFESEIEIFRQKYGVFRSENALLNTQKNLILFRGINNVNLFTTLERKTNRKFDIVSYLRYVYKARHELEAFTGVHWKLPNFNNLQGIIGEKQDMFNPHVPVPVYEFLVYLRHHGFPSPLLDWTESPYIAAYFAYLNSTKDNPPIIYCYIERPSLSKMNSEDEPRITVLGKYIRTDKRHFTQRARYTIATQWDDKRKKHFFCTHEKVFSKRRKDQDVLFRIILSESARKDALRKLNDYNINHFTLFQSEDALVKALETKHFDLDDLWLLDRDLE